MRRGGGNILNRMENASRYEHLIARCGDDFFIANGQLELADHDAHKFVRRMDEIIPLLAGRIGEEITGVAALSPVAGDLVSVGRYREFMLGKIGHDHVAGSDALVLISREPSRFPSHLMNPIRFTAVVTKDTPFIPVSPHLPRRTLLRADFQGIWSVEVRAIKRGTSPLPRVPLDRLPELANEIGCCHLVNSWAPNRVWS